MKEHYEDVYADIEDRHPWFVARRALFTELAALDRDARILDVGCGTGMFLVHLKSLGFRDLAGVEISAGLRRRTRDAEIPIHTAIPDETFDAVFMMDVLEHVADDVGMLARVHSIVRPGGVFLISVPAHPFLWGPHDVANEHKRRYRRRELREKLIDAGFEIERFSYWNTSCFPIACLVRWLRRGKVEEVADVELGPPLALQIYGRILAVENRLLRWMNLPIGISLVARARKKAPRRATVPGYDVKMTADGPPLDRAGLPVDGCFLVSADGDRYLDLAGSGGGVAPGIGARLAAAFAAECAACDVRGALLGGPDVYTIEFEGQENASPALMSQACCDELRQAGVLASRSGTLVLHPAMGIDDVDFAENALRHVARRMRTLLVEHNSYLSGGLRYPFPPSAAGVAERGLAIYRFPKTGNVDVTAVDDRIRIAFAPGDVGPITSSGFYLPTLIHGDFSVEARYSLCEWHPDAVEPACFALFAQNEDSSHRYYAQRMSAGEESHRLVASHVDQLSAEHPVTGDHGSFRVSRVGDTMTCSHREPGGDWLVLGTAPVPAESEMILGAKIWTKLRSGGLCVEIRDLRIDGRLAARQVPPVPVVDDPRGDTSTHA